jgi:hypothetical protein
MAVLVAQHALQIPWPLLPLEMLGNGRPSLIDLVYTLLEIVRATIRSESEPGGR